MATHKLVIDIPCRLCSHNRSQHNELLDPIVDSVWHNNCCMGCYMSFGEISCFHEFEADNLKYLELCIKQKELNA